MKLFCIILLCAFVAPTVQDYGGVVYPTDCPGGGSDCFGKVFNESKTLMELFTNVRKNFPWAEVQMNIEDVPVKQNETVKQCSLCEDPTIIPSGEGAFKLGVKGKNDAGCKILEVTCDHETNDNNVFNGTNSVNGIFTCGEDKKWNQGDKICGVRKQTCAQCVPLIVGKTKVVKSHSLGYDKDGCQMFYVLCATGKKLGGNVQQSGGALICLESTTYHIPGNKKATLQSDAVCAT